jgi:hypothetical protein
MALNMLRATVMKKPKQPLTTQPEKIRELQLDRLEDVVGGAGNRMIPKRPDSNRH